MTTERTAVDALRAWLEADGFRFAEDRFRSSMNSCDWYAYRRSAIPARECETNDGKPAQIVVKVFDPIFRDGAPDATVELCGEAGGTWWKLQAYGVGLDEIRAKLMCIEESLVAAWNALHPITSPVDLPVSDG